VTFSSINHKEEKIEAPLWAQTPDRMITSLVLYQLDFTWALSYQLTREGHYLTS